MKNIIVSFLALSLFSCGAAVVTPGDVTGKIFPRINGTSLDGKAVTVPDDFRGKETLLLIGYKQNAQFDIDRWILGALQANISVQIVELPTIAGMMPRAVQSFIDSGMRSGIPREDWASVVTVYEDAAKIIQAIGNENPQNAHAVLLNKEGSMQWITNRGYSAQQVLELKRLVESN